MNAWPWWALDLAPLDWYGWHADGHDDTRVDLKWIGLNGVRL